MKRFIILFFLSFATQFVFAQSDTTRLGDADVITVSHDTIVYSTVSVMPSAAYEMSAYLSRNTKYPQDAKENGKQGVAYISFIVETDGSISNVAVYKSSGTASLDKEALRVISLMPKWKPGMQDGKAVRVRTFQVVQFRLM